MPWAKYIGYMERIKLGVAVLVNIIIIIMELSLLMMPIRI